MIRTGAFFITTIIAPKVASLFVDKIPIEAVPKAKRDSD
jgi:hypothetical protein